MQQTPPPGMAGSTTAPGFDPRRMITQEAFSVAPHLLGLPLARPSRRLAAILLDLLLVSILVNVGGSVLFGLAAALAFFRFASARLGRGGGFLGKTARLGFRVAGGFILFAVALGVWDRAADRVKGAGDEDDDGVQVNVSGVTAGGPKPTLATAGAAVRMVGDLSALGSAADSAEAHTRAADAVRRMRTLRMQEGDIRRSLSEAVRNNRNPGVQAGVGAAISAVDWAQVPGDSAAKPLSPDSMAKLYAAAVASDDSAAADTLAPRLGAVLAKDTLDALRGEVGGLRTENRELEKRKEELEHRGLLAGLLDFLNDLGIGFGWTGLYFTAFTALWKGQTPGKKVLGIRVMRLNGQPMTLWASFERFGGYAAGVLTGLLGFAQVFWDRNRQAIHDKITETVVIRDRGAPLPQPRPAVPYRPPAQAGLPPR